MFWCCMGCRKKLLETSFYYAPVLFRGCCCRKCFAFLVNSRNILLHRFNLFIFSAFWDIYFQSGEYKLETFSNVNILLKMVLVCIVCLKIFFSDLIIYKYECMWHMVLSVHDVKKIKVILGNRGDIKIYNETWKCEFIIRNWRIQSFG